MIALPRRALALAPALVAAAAALAACASNSAPGGPPPAGRGGPGAPGGPGDRTVISAANRFAAAPPARAELRDQDNKVVGTATLTQGPAGLLIAVDLNGLPPGAHAMHVHDVGRCEPPFTNAGSHYNPTIRGHGVKNANGAHAGDLPNVTIPAGGSTRVEVFSTALQLGPGVGSVFDTDGSSLLIHSNADDYQSDPAGNAGTRIACGVITR